MSYIENGVWKRNDGSPIMNVPTNNIKEVENLGHFLAVYYDGWCEACQNPSIRWTLYDITGEPLSSSIGGHTLIEAAKEDAKNEVDNFS